MPTFRVGPRRHLERVLVGFQIGLRGTSIFETGFEANLRRREPALIRVADSFPDGHVFHLGRGLPWLAPRPLIWQAPLKINQNHSLRARARSTAKQ